MSDAANDDAEFTGKYESAGPIGGRLINGFYDSVRGMLEPIVRVNTTMVEVGSGAGYSTQRLREWLPPTVKLIGSDVRDSLILAASARNPRVPFLRQSVYELPFANKTVDVVVMLEVLEHLDNPNAALRELSRITRGQVLLSTPREPLWRALNMARGKYLRDWGNTPGHVQHWSSQGLQRLVSSYFHVERVRRPIPWTILRLKPRQ